MDGFEKLLTVKQVAARLQLGLRTIYEHIAGGCLKAVRNPTGSIRIRESDLDDFLTPVEARAAREEASCKPN